jgi:long-chain fatty acid transport protein
MKKTFLVLLFSLVLATVTPLANASGFLIYEHNAAAQAMGGAFIAVANNPSAIFHNPAGLAWLEGTQVSAGGTFIMPKGSVSLPNWPVPAYRKIDMEDQTFFAPNFYLTHKFGNKVAAGIGVFAPYGLGTKWPDPEHFPLRYIGTSNDMQTIFVNPAFAFKVTDNLAIGFGVSYIHSSLSLDLVRLIEINHPVYGVLLWKGDVPASVDGASGNAVGFNAGLLYKADKFSLGFNWRSAFDIKYEGKLKLDWGNMPAYLKALIPVPNEGDVSTKFKFPHIFGVGVAYNATDKLLLSADAHYVLWSRYDKYVIDLTYTGLPGESETVTEDWKDSILLRGGLQYQLNESLALRAGILYDQTPQPEKSVDCNLPDANRVALTCGFGYKFGHLVVDATYHYEVFNDRKSPNRDIYNFPHLGNLGEGTYKMKAHLIGITLTYLF